MEINVDKNTFFVFDLDDTLFQEIEFLKSGYRHIAKKLEPGIQESIYDEMITAYGRKENVFGSIVDKYKSVLPHLTLPWLLKEYREHVPVLSMNDDTLTFLKAVAAHSIPIGLITDGRSITQRNKLKALGIESFFKEVIISEEFGSEKPDPRNYLYFENKYPGKRFYFFGDNTSKDFIVPAKLGWKTICVKDCGYNIHPQKPDAKPAPDYIIRSFGEITLKEIG